MERIGNMNNDVGWIDTQGRWRRGALLGVARINDRWVALAIQGVDGCAVEVDVLDCELGLGFVDDQHRAERARRWMTAHPGRSIDWGASVAPRGL